MPELFQISRSHSGIGKKGGSMDLVRLSGGLLVKEAERIGLFLEAVLASLPPFRPRPGNPTGASLSYSGDS
jgi:hypothetical protein